MVAALLLIKFFLGGIGIGYSYEVPAYTETMFTKWGVIYPSSSLIRGGQKAHNWPLFKKQVSSHYGRPPDHVNSTDDDMEIWIYKEYTPKQSYLGLVALLTFDSCESRDVRYTFSQDELIKTELQEFQKRGLLFYCGLDWYIPRCVTKIPKKGFINCDPTTYKKLNKLRFYNL